LGVEANPLSASISLEIDRRVIIASTKGADSARP
jgi:hypothetical protein